MRVANYWEDDYGQLEIVPREEGVRLTARGIRLDELHAAIAADMPPFDRVTYELHTSVELPAYGASPDVVLFVPCEGEIVRELWGNLDPKTEEDVTATLAGLAKLARWDLVLVDCGWSRTIPLGDAAELEAYMRERLIVFGHPRLQEWSTSPRRR